MLKLYLFGSPRIEIDDTAVEIPRRKSMALLVYLLVTRQPQRRDTLVAMLWPESSQKAGRASLRRELHHVNQTIGNGWLNASRDTIEMTLNGETWIDIEAFLTQTSSHLAQDLTQLPEEVLDTLATAVNLYQGEFMAGFTLSDCPEFDEWQFFQGDALRQQYARLLLNLVDHYENQAQFDEAIVYARRWLALDTMHEPVHRKLMQLFALAGHQAAAIRQYDECVRILNEEIGVPPEEETTALYEAIRTRKLGPPRVETAKASVPETAVLPKSTHHERVSIPVPLPKVRVDWGEAPDVRFFYGREEELDQLDKWLRTDHCRLIAILGMGGMGKTALTAKHLQNIADPTENIEEAPPFERIIWRSLLNAPPLTDILSDWLRFLSDHQLTQIPETLDQRLMLLLNYLRQQRCLLVLDNMESIMESGEQQTGEYRAGYEEYGQLLERVGGSDHQSCLILTSRERPQIVRRLEGDTPLVQSLALAGLAADASKHFLEDRGLVNVESDTAKLVARYSGNPLALKLIAETIQDLFAGDVELFLAEETLIFDDIRSVLDQQFSRLSPIEREIMVWLMLEREAITPQEILANLAQQPTRRSFLEALRSLERRSLLTKVTAESGIGFTLQNVLIEYITDRFIEQICQEIEQADLDDFCRYALVKAQAKDYIRESQKRLILQPIANQLTNAVGTIDFENSLHKQLAQIQAEEASTPSYAAGNILNLLLYLETDLQGLDFSGLPVWQAYLRDTQLLDVNFAQADLTGSVFMDTFGAITTAVFSPDGKKFAVGTNDGQIRFWQTEGNVPLLSCNAHSTGVMSIAFSPDGQLLVSGGDDHDIHFWNTQTGQRVKTIKWDLHEVLSVAISPDGRILASGGADKVIFLWDMQSGDHISTLSGHTDWIWSVKFSPDGTLMASSGEDNTIRLWDMQSRDCIGIFEGHTNQIRSIAFSPDGQLVASASFDHTVRLWQVESGQMLYTLTGHTDPVRGVTISPNGQLLASCGYDQKIRLWDVATGELINTLSGHGEMVRAVDFSPDGQTLLSGSFDRTARLWDVHNGYCLDTLSGYTNWIRSITVSQDGKTIISGSEDQMIRFWDFETGRCLKTLSGHAMQVWSVTVSPDGKTLASSGGDNTFRLWDMETGQLLRTESVFTNRMRSLAFSPDGSMLAGSIDEETLSLWDVQTGKAIRTLSGHTKSIWEVVFSPDGRLLASCGNDSTVRLWDVYSGECLNVLSGHTQPVLSVKFSPDGKRIASGSDDQTVRLWDVESGENLFTLPDHTNWVWSVAFSPDGKTLASSSSDQLIILWDVERGEKICTFSGHLGAILSIAFGADGQTIVSGSTDKMIRIWDVESGTCLKTIQNERPYERMNIIGATGLTKAQTETLRILGAVEVPV